MKLPVTPSERHRLLFFHPRRVEKRLFVLRCITDSNDEDPLSQEVSFGHGVLCEASLLCSGRVMQTAISKGEIPPDKLITSHVFFRKNNPGLLCPPQLGLTKGHLVSVKDLFEKYWNHREQGQCFSETKSLMAYFTVGLMFCVDLFCVLLGAPLILWDGRKSLS